MLIQARQLVNGVSILRDTGQRTVTYHHVELERHAVMLADGLPCESYLDTGNRAQFDDAAVAALHSAFGRADDPGACAPLVTEGDRIHPIWLAIAGRASWTGSLPNPRTTREAELCLVLADGSVLQPGEVGADGRHVFWFDGPAMTGRVRLRSRCGAACEIRPWLDDRRRLGVAVGELMAWMGHDGDKPGPLDLDGLSMADGWWAAERDGTRTWRWTNGDAALELPPGCCRLDVLVTGTAEYQLHQEPVPRAA